jgi:hypothetical protein
VAAVAGQVLEVEQLRDVHPALDEQRDVDREDVPGSTSGSTSRPSVSDPMATAPRSASATAASGVMPAEKWRRAPSMSCGQYAM